MRLSHLFHKTLNQINIEPGNTCKIIDSKNLCGYDISCHGNSNIIVIGKNCDCKKLVISVSGHNNKIVIGDELRSHTGIIEIQVIGSDNTITLGNKITCVESLHVYNHANTMGGKVEIGNDTSFYKTEIHNYDSGACVQIGSDCMFAYDTVIYNTDGHTILVDGAVSNRATFLHIGNHVWVAMGAEILKNSSVPDGSIVARRALVSGKFTTNNCILAGIPAREIKKNITWDRRHPNEYLGDNHA